MDAGKLIQDILQAGERAKSVVPCYMGKPYTATTVNLMGRDIVLSLESINRELRKELGIELYVDVIPDFTNQVSAVQGFLKVRRCNIEWVELSGEDYKERNQNRKQLHIISQKSS